MVRSLAVVQAPTEPLEANPKDQRPAADVLELLLHLVHEIGGRALERGVAVGRGTGNKAGAKPFDEPVELVVQGGHGSPRDSRPVAKRRPPSCTLRAALRRMWPGHFVPFVTSFQRESSSLR